MKGQFVTDAGNVNINLDVIARYAGMCAVECFGIVGMAAVSMRDGLARLLKKESLSKGIDVSVKDGELCFDFHVIVSYGVSIATVAENLMQNTYSAAGSLVGPGIPDADGVGAAGDSITQYIREAVGVKI